VPYAALLVFLAGLVYNVAQWAAAPVPFRIPLTCGQQTSFPWLKAAWIENPSTRGGVFARMVLELLVFRSLFRNTRADLRDGLRFVYAWNGSLWLAALALHWSLLLIVVRHLRFALVPVPGFVFALDKRDGFFQVGMQGLFLTDALVLLALGYLLARTMTWQGRRYAMAGVLPVDVEVCDIPQGHGYVELEVDQPNPFFPVGLALRGHEFHYSRVVPDGSGPLTACRVTRGAGTSPGRDGITVGNVWAGYTHVHAIATPEWITGLIAAARRRAAPRAGSSDGSIPHGLR